MDKRIGLLAIILAIVGVLQLPAQNKKKETVPVEKAIEQATIKTTNDSLSYALGFNMGKQGLMDFLKQLGISDNPEKFDLFLKGLRESLPANGKNSAYITGLSVGDQTISMMKNFHNQVFETESTDSLDLILVTRGIEDAIFGKKELVDSTELIISKTMLKSNERMETQRAEKEQAKIAASNKFMEENKTKEGVVTLPSGLQYKILVKGNGEIPTETDIVSVFYEGSLIDGTVFDDSYQRGTPTVLAVNQVIKGWTEALLLMPAGSKWMLYIPYELGYGSKDTGAIPAYSTLIFELDLIDVKKGNEKE